MSPDFLSELAARLVSIAKRRASAVRDAPTLIGVRGLSDLLTLLAERPVVGAVAPVFRLDPLALGTVRLVVEDGTISRRDRVIGFGERHLCLPAREGGGCLGSEPGSAEQARRTNRLSPSCESVALAARASLCPGSGTRSRFCGGCLGACGRRWCHGSSRRPPAFGRLGAYPRSGWASGGSPFPEARPLLWRMQRALVGLRSRLDPAFTAPAQSPYTSERTCPRRS
jgi:hypothetical protein